MMRWGANLGATGAYLQVVKENESAIRLYEKLEFKADYEYWYRVKHLPRKT
jgi:ribosomal protein S18 acetylase RimI-like enzyme